MKHTIYTLALFIFLSIPTFSYSQNQQGMRHEFVKHGKHASEMTLGDYVVLRVAASEINAKEMAEEIRKSGYTEVGYGYLTNKESWYIYIKSGNDIEEAKVIRDKYRKNERFKDAWLLTVHQ